AGLFDSEVNPMVARHGGRVELIDVQDAVVMLRMGGGCQGCGMADVTLRQGIEAMLQQHVPEVKGVVDITDHSAGTDPYFAAAKELKGNPVTAALAARDKHRQRVLLAEHGVPAPAFELHALEEDPAGLAHRVRYPCVLKPLRLSASRGVMRADDGAGFVSAFGRLKAILKQPDVAACGEPARHFLVEDFVPGVEVALEGLVADGCLRVLALFD